MANNLTAGENDTTSEIFETALNDTTVLDVREKDSMKKHYINKQKTTHYFFSSKY
jgi:hypothetical protein